MRLSVLFVACIASTSPVLAETLSIVLPGKVETISAAYSCPSGRMDVTYHNAEGVSLAVFEVGGETVVASNVLSASGARYAGGQYVWWTKGAEGDLYDLTKGEDAPPVHCGPAG